MIGLFAWSISFNTIISLISSRRSKFCKPCLWVTFVPIHSVHWSLYVKDSLSWSGPGRMSVTSNG
jgi:hypothetical protein